jgi:insulysin
MSRIASVRSLQLFPLSICLLCLALFACSEAQQPVQPAASLAEAVVKSPNDRRDYRAITLDNNLKVLLIHDPETDKAAAAMDVRVGSGHDPEGYQGLTHFLEHMLFLGTGSFPEAGEYQAYITGHGGSNNAYTAYENTNYYFDIEKGYLAPALERFSRFFIDPLLTPDYVDRERNAVHSEYQSNLQNDGRRAYEIFKSVINPRHPLAKFSVGSLETLRDHEGEGSLRDALLTHYEAYYSANLMSLAILGNESLDELEAMAREYFTAVPDRGASLPAVVEPLFSPGSLPALVQIRPVRDSRSVSYTFPLPPVVQYYRYKPLNYLANLIGHEGEGSLLSLLKELGWANGLSAGGGLSYEDVATFSVSVSLTEEGVNRIDEISSLLFEYIDLVAEQGIHEWMFQEQKVMAELSFLFQEPTQPINLVSSLASARQQYPASEIMTAGYTYEAFDADLIRRFLDYLRPENVLLTVTGLRVETDKLEPRFGGAYSVAPLAEQRIAAWRPSGSRNTALQMPAPNPFIPEDIALKPLEKAANPDLYAKPAIILDEEGVRLWFKQDDFFRVPRAYFYMTALTPVMSQSVENSLKGSLAMSLVNDALREFTYPASLAGLGYGVSSGSRGVSLRISGYSDNQEVLLEEVLKALVAADFTQERFDIIKTEMLRSLENASKQTPYIRLIQNLQGLLVSPFWTEEQRMQALTDITLEQVRAFVPEILASLRIEALYHGNITRAEAESMMAMARRYLQPSAQAPVPPFSSVVRLDAGTRSIYEQSIDHEDSAIVIYQQAPDDSLRTRATVSLLGSMLRTPFYESLRTEQQLGYVVSAGSMPIMRTNGIVMYIESPNTDPLALESHINEFLASYSNTLQEMPDAIFEEMRAGLLNNLRQRPQRLNALSGRFWSDIQIGEYEADSTRLMADEIALVTRQAVQSYFDEFVANTGSARVVARSAGHPHRQTFLAAKASEADAIYVENEATFKDGAAFFHFMPE